MTWDTTQPVENLYFKTAFKAWRHPSNTNGAVMFGGLQVYAWEITPTGQWVSFERYWKGNSSTSSILSELAFQDGGAFVFLEGGPIWISDIVISQAADIVTWQRDKTSAYSPTASDLGKRISITTGGVTLSTNFNSACPTGAWIEVYNNSDVPQYIGIQSPLTMRLAASGSTGTRTLDGRGIAVLNKVGLSEWLIHGWGVS